MNIQKTSPIVRESKTLDVSSIFTTIQGEGPFSGHPAIFIRLSGCNLQCPLCDTDYTSVNKKMTPDAILEGVKSLLEFDPHINLIVITGGEPFRQPLRELTDLLIESKLKVQIETNGTLYQDLNYGALTVVCSPKTSNVNDMLARHIRAFKYIVKANDLNNNKGVPHSCLDHVNNNGVYLPPWETKIYLSPCDEKDEIKNKANIDATVEACIKYGHILSLQIHKIIKVE